MSRLMTCCGRCSDVCLECVLDAEGECPRCSEWSHDQGWHADHPVLGCDQCGETPDEKEPSDV